MVDEPVRVAIVGLGVMGRDHLKNALALQQEGVLRLVGLSDVEGERVRQAGAEHDIPVFETVEALLDETKPEFVVVATPHPSHEAMTAAAAERGIHVLCEKPIAHTVAAADRMIDACRRAGVLLGIDFNQRTTPAYIRAHEMIAGGELGDLYRVNFIASGWYRTQSYYDSGGWRGTWEGEGGGVIMNQAPHHLDLYCWLAGLPQRVKATALTRIHEIEVENTVAALLEHGTSRVDTFYTTTAEWPGRTEFLFAGERGRLAVAERQLRLYRLERSLSEELLTSPHGSKPAGTWEDIDVEPAGVGQSGHIALLRQFARAVRSGQEAHLLATGEDGRRALELGNAMLLSSFRDYSVDLPIDRQAYDALLAELRAKAATGELKKRHSTGESERVLATLPEGT
ncbi:MAG: Gfo/Idh/MocA family oxidoreductase [Chloroflexota bacterium]|nr:Gfo/Idh/MocA family oxidoreductase [Chloroflexota bacterium]